MRLFLTAIFQLICFAECIAQPAIRLDPMNIDELPAVHSGVFLTYENKWVMVGGRTNGLHGFQGFFLFPELTQNFQIIVADPIANKVWKASVNQLPKLSKEHITSSNMQWTERNGNLYIFGGYGYSSDKDDFITFPRVTKVNIAGLVNAVINGSSINDLFQSSDDERFAVCGGYCDYVSDTTTFSLVFGHRFDGLYNRISGIVSKQEYNSAIRVFKINPTTLAVESFSETKDSALFRKRDYNLVAQYDGTKAYMTSYSGVFQQGRNLPYRDVIELKNTTAKKIDNFEQKYAHYHSAVIPVWDETDNSMNTFFIGGMAQFYPDSVSRVIIEDTLIPFVRTISLVRKNSSGLYTESVAGRLPSYLGTNMYFFPIENTVDDYVVRRKPNEKEKLIGYLAGGIYSPKANISLEDPALSSASTYIFKVYIGDGTLSVHESERNTQPTIFAQVINKQRDIQFTVFGDISNGASIELHSLNGTTVATIPISTTTESPTIITHSNTGLAQGFYIAVLRAGGRTSSATFAIVK